MANIKQGTTTNLFGDKVNINFQEQAKRLVLTCLEMYPETRDSDQLLQFYVWKMQGMSMSKQEFMSYIQSSTITRYRRKIQEAGHFPASKEVKQKREKYNEIIQQEKKDTGARANF